MDFQFWHFRYYCLGSPIFGDLTAYIAVEGRQNNTQIFTPKLFCIWTDVFLGFWCQASLFRILSVRNNVSGFCWQENIMSTSERFLISSVIYKATSRVMYISFLYIFIFLISYLFNGPKRNPWTLCLIWNSLDCIVIVESVPS